jgi:hypothetical protein
MRLRFMLAFQGWHWDKNRAGSRRATTSAPVHYFSTARLGSLATPNTISPTFSVESADPAQVQRYASTDGNGFLWQASPTRFNLPKPYTGIDVGLRAIVGGSVACWWATP